MSFDFDFDPENRKKRIENEHLKIERERLEILRRQERHSQQNYNAGNSSGGSGCLSVMFIMALIAVGFYYFASGNKQNHTVHPA